MEMSQQELKDHIEKRLKERREQLQENRKNANRLFLRNILNCLFIIIALVAMVGIVMARMNKADETIWYVVGIFAVMIKMVEALLRMPGFKKETKRHL